MPSPNSSNDDRYSRNPLFYTLQRSVAANRMMLCLSGLICLLVMFAGCHASKPSGGSPPPPEAPDHSREVTLRASPKRLADDAGRAFSELGWGTLHVKVQNLQAEPDVDGKSRTVVDAAALLPNGKEAHVWAWPAEGENLRKKTDVVELKVALRIGYFGDVDPTVELLESIKAFLQGPPRREYGGSFELPPYPDAD